MQLLFSCFVKYLIISVSIIIRWPHREEAAVILITLWWSDLSYQIDSEGGTRNGYITAK